MTTSDAISTDSAALLIADRTRQMDALKQVPVSVAQSLLKGGQSAIDQARALANAAQYAGTRLTALPGGTARDNVYWKLQWHQNNLKDLAANPNAMYPSGDDLKKWVSQAFIELDTVQYGLAYTQNLWSTMWAEIAIALAALPKEVLTAVSKEVGLLSREILGMPLWLFGLLGIGTAVVGIRVVGAVQKKVL